MTILHIPELLYSNAIFNVQKQTTCNGTDEYVWQPFKDYVKVLYYPMPPISERAFLFERFQIQFEPHSKHSVSV
jgi:hypothetical protein